MYYKNCIVKFAPVDIKDDVEGLQVCYKHNDKWVITRILEIGSYDNSDRIIWVYNDEATSIRMKAVHLSSLKTIVMMYNDCCGRCDGIDDICDGKQVEVPLHEAQWQEVFSIDNFQGKFFECKRTFNNDYCEIVFPKKRSFTYEEMRDAFNAGMMYCARENKTFPAPDFEKWIKNYE